MLEAGLDIKETNLLQENSSGKSALREEAIEILLESVTSEENCSTPTLAASILSNLGGTYSWTGEPYTAAWLVKRAGLTSVHHRNMIQKVDWFDPCLQVLFSFHPSYFQPEPCIMLSK